MRAIKYKGIQTSMGEATETKTKIKPENRQRVSSDPTSIHHCNGS